MGVGVAAAPVTISSTGIGAQQHGYEDIAEDNYYMQKGLFQRSWQGGSKVSRSKKQVRATAYQKDKRMAQSARDRPPVLDGMGDFSDGDF
jgi:hypothetical protein